MERTLEDVKLTSHHKSLEGRLTAHPAPYSKLSSTALQDLKTILEKYEICLDDAGLQDLGELLLAIGTNAIKLKK